MTNKKQTKKDKKPTRVDCTVLVEKLELKSKVHELYRTDCKLSGNVMPPMKIDGLWDCDSLHDMMDIDNDPKRGGIPGDKKSLKRLKDWLKRHQKRPDIAEKLYLENGRIKTRMSYKTIFPQNI